MTGREMGRWPKTRAVLRQTIESFPDFWAAASLEAPVKANRGSCPEARTTGQNAKCVRGSLAFDAVPHGAFLPPPKPTFLFHCVPLVTSGLRKGPDSQLVMGKDG